MILCILVALAGCTIPTPTPHNIPTSPAILDITPAPTLDVAATATVLANKLRPTPTPAGLYIVQTGDSLSTIAVEFDTTVEEIMVANGLTDANTIKDGQALIIPSLLPEADDHTPAIITTTIPTTTVTLPITTTQLVP
jgi:LysM repeat protein